MKQGVFACFKVIVCEGKKLYELYGYVVFVGIVELANIVLFAV